MIHYDRVLKLRKLYKVIQYHSKTMELVALYTLEQNRIAEHINWTIIEKSKAILFSTDLSLRL